jgi:hypothetical protein
MKEKNLILEDKWRDLKSQEINIAEVRTGNKLGYIQETNAVSFAPLLAKPEVALWPEPSPGDLPEGGPLASGKLTLLSDQFFYRKR